MPASYGHFKESKWWLIQQHFPGDGRTGQYGSYFGRIIKIWGGNGNILVPIFFGVVMMFNQKKHTCP